ncbi:hypothetical protein P3T36_001690 [Kitasatospora sp. MAP12-15]|uniref:hypothetical protein n=1 Tax=unclassified Kitasatospora TaxID=2633591 RepID=UPI00247381A5|nr:hypothetical protein [Kitasatospora sp. MAP12-44]MDH6113431.1 hypothetical protein [Kitasatospora sp. MAP12-44]
MSSELVQLAEQAGPYLSAAASAYGTAVFTRAQDAAADATANLGQRILQAVWRRRGRPDQAALAVAVGDAKAEPGSVEAAAYLRLQIERALREDDGLRAEIVAMLPSVPQVTVTATGERGIAAHQIGTVINGDNNSIQR